MKAAYQLRIGGAPLEVNLLWNADAVSIINPTGKTILMRIGGNDVPSSVVAADLIVPALSAVTYPVAGSAFGAAFGLPALVAQPAALPASASITFLANEPLPSYGSLSLSTLDVTAGAPQEQLLFTAPNRMSGSYIDTVPLPANIHAVAIVVYGSGGPYTSNSAPPTSVTIHGHDSGIVYATFVPGNNFVTPVAVYSALDTSLDIAIDSAGNNSGAYRLIGLRNPVFGVQDKASVLGVSIAYPSTVQWQTILMTAATPTLLTPYGAATRKRLLIRNQSPTERLFINGNSAVSNLSYFIDANSVFEDVTSQSLYYGYYTSTPSDVLTLVTY